MIKIPQMLLIGSAGRNSGKTTLAKRFVSLWKDEHPLIGAKIVTIKEVSGGCQRGVHGCSICTSLKGEYEIIPEEVNPLLLKNKKDTQLLLEVGCRQVFFIKCLKTHLFQMIEDLLTQLPEKKILICESNSLRTVVEPGVFIFLNNQPTRMKPSAQEVVHWADAVLTSVKGPLPNIQIDQKSHLKLVNNEMIERSSV